MQLKKFGVHFFFILKLNFFFCFCLQNLKFVSDLSLNEEEENNQNWERDKELLWPLYPCMKRAIDTEETLVQVGKTRKSPDFTCEF